MRAHSPEVLDATCNCGVLVPVGFVTPSLVIMTLPFESMRSLSVDEFASSAVVWNTSRPGISFAPGVPSTSPLISAALVWRSVPSAPAKPINPKLSPS